jgi:uncharacterized protein YcsI (UPF0317 family)
MDRQTLRDMPPGEVRQLIREGKWRGVTAFVSAGYAQANLAILPKSLAFEFLLFCQRNPKPCPVLEVSEPGNPILSQIAKGADIRTDIPKYRIYQKGKYLAEVENIKDYWRDDLVAFLIGCSYTFESAMDRANIPLRHVQDNKNVSVYITNIPCVPAGIFSGPMVVSMRPIPEKLVTRAIQVTSRFPATHGAPVHVGDPQKIGVRDLQKVDWGDPLRFEKDDVPVFWACGVTPQAVAMASKPEIMITHSAGHMFLSDIRDEELAAL